jgi:hypothetical protein
MGSLLLSVKERRQFSVRVGMGGITPGDVLRIFVRQDASQGEIDYALQLFHLATAERALNNQRFKRRRQQRGKVQEGERGCYKLADHPNH